MNQVRRNSRKTAGATAVVNQLIDTVVGLSKLPLVAEMVAGAFPDCRVVLSDKPFLSVVRGAANRGGPRAVPRRVLAAFRADPPARSRRRRGRPDLPSGHAAAGAGRVLLEKVAWYHPRHNIGH